MARISNAAIESELRALAAIISDHDEGISREELAGVYAQTHYPLEKRTLYRRLKHLVAERVIEVERIGRKRLYRSRIASPPLARSSEPHALSNRGEFPAADLGRGGFSSGFSSGFEDYVPLSPEGEEVRALVRRPRTARPPVGYDSAFLERYRPGETWYLPPQTRAHLATIGQTPAADQPAGTYARQIHEYLLIDLSWASSKLEGNTYTKLDTRELLRYGREADGKDAEETQMILNHKAAIELLIERAADVGFNRRTFLELHAALSENLVGDRQNEGRLRTRLVDIGGTTYRPLAIPQKIEEQFDLLLQKAREIPDAFEQAFFVMVHLPYLQPFIDVNKRTSRLGANLPLIKANLCPLSFVDVPKQAYTDGTIGVYELQRVELLRDVFTWAYERSCAQYAVVREALGKPDPIRLKYREQLRDVVRRAVQEGILPDPDTLFAWARGHGIPDHESLQFVESAREELLDLHDGSLARYRLRPSELAQWQAKVSEPGR